MTYRSALLILVLTQLVSVSCAQTTAADYYEKGEAQYDSGNFDGAIADYTRAIKLDSNDADSYRKRGLARYSKDDLDGAMADYTKAIELYPKKIKYYTERSGTSDNEVLVTIEDVKASFERVKASLKAISLIHNHSRAYSDRGSVRRVRDDLKGALADYTSAIEIDPRNAEAHYYSGKVRSKLKDYDGAIADFTKAIEIAPKVDLAFNDRADLFVRQGGYRRALADLSKAIELDPTKVRRYWKRAWTKLYLNDGAGAHRDAERFLELNGLDGNDGPYGVIVGYLGLRKSQKTVSASAFVNFWLKQVKADTWTTQILRYFAGQLTAEQLLATAVDNDELTEAHAYIGEMKLFTGDRRSAAEHFRWVELNGNRDFSEYVLATEELERF